MNLPEVIIESHIPFTKGVLDGVAKVEYLPPEAFTPDAVRNADALIVRTRTRCSHPLLSGSKVRFIATATIGTDHIDFPFCRDAGITVASAPGCNAPAVAQYVWSSILSMQLPLTSSSVIGIVGLGHVGSIVAQWTRQLGVQMLACDPPRRELHAGYNPERPSLPGSEPFVSLEEIAARADIITFHTPHTASGPYPTHHLCNTRFLGLVKPGAVIINAARGPIIDTEAVLSPSASRRQLRYIIDCWEGEPSVSKPFLEAADIATPHIAGYSIQGKQRATAMAIGALLDFLSASEAAPEAAIAEARARFMAPPVAPPALAELTPEVILSSYSPEADTSRLKATLNLSPAEAASAFESLRNNYSLRSETGF